MKRIILVLLLLIINLPPILAQSDMTKITTTKDNMEGIKKATIDWGSISARTPIICGLFHGHHCRDDHGFLYNLIHGFLSLFQSNNNNEDEEEEGSGSIYYGSNSGGGGTVTYGGNNTGWSTNGGSTSGGEGTIAGGSAITATATQAIYLLNDVTNIPKIDSLVFKDTLQIVRLPCDTSINAIGEKITDIFNAVKNDPFIVATTTAATTAKNEKGCAINKWKWSNKTISYSISDTVTGGPMGVNVNPGNNAVAVWHTHIYKDSMGHEICQGQSPDDIYNTDSFYIGNNQLQTNYVHWGGGDNNSNYATTITNPALVSTFLQNYPNLSSAIPFTGSQWSGSINNPNSLNSIFSIANDYFQNHGCNVQDAYTYANAALMDQANLGINQFVMDSNGNFKELNVKMYIGVDGKPAFVVIICQ